MSVVESQSILLGEFNGLSDENRKLRGEMIEITLGQEKLIEENNLLREELERKEKEMVECRLREKNFQHSLEQVKKFDENLKEEYNHILALTTCQNPLQLRTLYKKQTQLAMDLAYIERQSYRQAKKSKNEQLSLYQSRIVSLLEQNDSLNKTILEMTAEYNEKLLQLKKKCYQSEYKLKQMAELEGRLKRINDSNNESMNNSNKPQQSISLMQLQLKLQNTMEKLHFYTEENIELRRRNLTLVQENDSLLQEISLIKKRQRQLQNNKEQQSINGNSNSDSNKIIEKDYSIQYMQSMMEENYKLRKEIQQITQKYILLAETYPELVEDFDAIRQLQDNIHKLSTINQLQYQLSQSHKQQAFLNQSLAKLQSKYLHQLKSRESTQYKCSILTKRFNEIFIKMNPYFNIYQYQSLELNQEEYMFFSGNKDYKQLKEYEREVGQLKRELKEEGYMREKQMKGASEKLLKKESELTKVRQELAQIKSQANTLNTANQQLTQQLHNYQLLNIDPHLINQRVNEHKLNNQVTLPLLEKLVEKLQLQREHLLKAIYEKDEKIVELARQAREATMRQRMEYVEVSKQHNNSNNNKVSSSSKATPYQQLTILIKKNQSLQQKYDSTVQQLTTLIHKLQSQLANQHDIYQMQTKYYQQHYTKQFMEMNAMIEKWKENCGKFKELLLEKRGKEQEREAMEGQNERGGEGFIDEGESQQQKEHREENVDQNNNNEMHPQPQHQHNLINNQQQNQSVLLSRQQVNLNNLDGREAQQMINLNQQGNNKLIGESTVQNLTAMLKKYEQQMNEVLTMCAKLTEEYNELKNQLQHQRQLQQLNITLTLTSNNLKQQLTQLKTTLQQKNSTLSIIESLYKTKQTQCQQLQSSFNKQTQLIQSRLQEEIKKNQILSKQLAQIKEKLYNQLSSSSLDEIINNQQQVMNKGEFQTIVVMHGNKNKEISNLVEKNKYLEARVEKLINQLNQIRSQSADRKSAQISPLEKSQIKQLTLLLQSTNVIDLIKKANQIILKQQQSQQQQQKEQKEQHSISQNKIVEEGELQQEEVQDKNKSLQY